MKLTAAELDNIESALTALHRATFQHRAWEQLQKAAGTDLDRASASLLKSVAHHPKSTCRVQDLAIQLGIEAPSVSRTAHDLESAGLLTRKQDSGDRRAFNLTLTAEGKAELQKLRNARRDKLSKVFEKWSPEDRRDIARLLNKMSQDISEQQTEKKD